MIKSPLNTLLPVFVLSPTRIAFFLPFVIIFSAGSMFMASCMKSASRNGGRASTPHAEVLLFALKQSKLWRALWKRENGRR